MRSVVLVPDEGGVAAFSGSLATIEPVVCDLTGPLPAAAARAEVLVTRGADPRAVAARLGELPRLRMIQLFSSGVDAWAGLTPDAVRLRGLGGAHGGEVAEWVLAQLLSHYRDLSGYRAKQREQLWRPHQTGTLVGKRVLVFGAGDIAENLRRRVEPCGAVVTLVGRTARAGVIDLAHARSMLGGQDVVVLALPLSAQTRGLVDAAFLAAMPDGGVLVNAGRGPLVDTDALVAALESGRLTAILDVTEPEPLPAGHRLWTAPGAVITPHSAAITHDTTARCWDAIARGVSEFLHTPTHGKP